MIKKKNSPDAKLLVTAKPIKGYKISKKGWIIIGVASLIFVITNPSLQAFKAYQGEVSYEGLTREYNFFLFSIYGDSGYRYLGILGNFFKINDQWEPPHTDKRVD